MSQSREDKQSLGVIAESCLAERGADVAAKCTPPIEALLHELQVRQIELEMQNEELRQAQLIIEESRNRYLDLFDFAPIGYLTLDRAGLIVEANVTAAELFGLTRGELLQRPFASFLLKAGAVEDWLRHFSIVFSIGGKRDCELTLRRAAAAPMHVRVDCLRMTSYGEAPLVRLAFTDITASKQVEERSRESERQLSGLIESAMDAIISVDEDQQIVLFNPAAERMFGWKSEDALGQSLDRLLPEVLRRRHVEHFRDFARAGVTNRFLGDRDDLHGLRANGELFPIEASLSRVEIKGRNLFTVILREISERKRVEQALRESQADLNRAQAVGQIGSWRLNLERNELIWSDENHRIFGVPRGTPLSYETFLAIVHPDDRDYVDRMWHEAVHGAPYDIDHRLLVNDSVKWVREKVELEYDAAGRLLGGFGTTQDITELKRAEQALIEADRRKDEFLAMLGHELRNPLTPIRNAAHVLGRLESREPHVRWAREIIERQVAHLTRLVDDLLDVSRIVRGKVNLRQESIELAGIVEQALDMARPLIQAKRHQLELRLPETPVWLLGDPVRLAQVLFNLLDNAVKYTPEGGRIELEASVAAGIIEFRLRDNGIGISDALRPHVFDLFQQGERGLDRAQGGLGIGLTLTRRLVELHGGQIEADSAGPERGSTFTIRLPVPSVGARALGASMPQPATGAATCRVLVVDDDPAVAESMTALLAIEGHHVKTAADGETALLLADQFRPQFVLLDIGLGGMDGYEVARRLRAQQRADDRLCLVAVTGYGHEEAMARSHEAGFDRHMVKPVYPEAICALLAELGGAPAAPA